MGFRVRRPNFRPKMVTGRGFAKTKTKNRNPIPEMYGEDWDELSLYVRRRDNWCCMIHVIANKRCSGRYPPPFHGMLHAHHIVSLPKGTNHPKNLISLCRECHGELHGKNLGKISNKQKSASRRAR